MFLDKFFAKIGHFFAGLFKSAADAYDKLEPEVQKALQYGSGIISTVNNFLSGPVGTGLLAILKEKFPDLPVDTVLNALKKSASILGQTELIVDGDLENSLKNLQTYLSSLKGTEWAFASDTFAKGIAAFTAPAGTQYAIISSLMESVYQRFFKKDKVVVPATTGAPATA